MIRRDEVAAFLSELYHVDRYQDRSMNGLQVFGANEVTGFTLGVDACRPLFEAAIDAGHNFIVVHHGFFWGAPLAVTPVWGQRFQTLLNHELSLFACHLPMDADPDMGHNALLAARLQLVRPEPFGRYKGQQIGMIGEWTDPVPSDRLATVLEERLGYPVQVLPFGGDPVRRVAVVSGDAAQWDLLEEAAAARADLFLTGETCHEAWHLARELGIHLGFGGHYRTETTSLLKLRDVLEEQFNLPARFVDLPTGF